MASYPNSIASLRDVENKSGVVYDADKVTIVYAEDVNNANAEIEAIETELGTLPKGGHSDVKARIVAGEKRAIIFIIDGGGSAITTGEKGHLRIPFKCEIKKVTLLADASGSTVIDIWKDTYANFPPTDADTITAAAPPTLSTAQKSEDATLTNWTKTIAVDDILAFNVDSAATITRIALILNVEIIA